MNWKTPAKSLIGHGPNWHICAFCGIWFNKKRNKKNDHTFCTQKCRGKFFSGERASNWNHGLKECRKCGKQYKFDYKKPKYYGRGKEFCSFKCRAAVIKRKSYKKPVPCQNCQKLFMKHEKKTRFCSRHCFMKFTKGNKVKV